MTDNIEVDKLEEDRTLKVRKDQKPEEIASEVRARLLDSEEEMYLVATGNAIPTMARATYKVRAESDSYDSEFETTLMETTEVVFDEEEGDTGVALVSRLEVG